MAFVTSNMRGAPPAAIEAMLDNRQLFMHTYLGDLLTLCARMIKDMHERMDAEAASSSATSAMAAAAATAAAGEDADAGIGQSVPYEMTVQLLKRAAEKGVVSGATGFAGTIAVEAVHLNSNSNSNSNAIFELAWLQALDSEKGLLVVMDRGADCTKRLESTLQKLEEKTQQEQEKERSGSNGNGNGNGLACTLLLHSPLLDVCARVQVRT